MYITPLNIVMRLLTFISHYYLALLTIPITVTVDNVQVFVTDG